MGDAATFPKILGFLLCDSTRIEMTNKLLLVGVYAESVHFASGPAQSAFSPVMMASASKAGTYEIRVRLSWPGIREQLVDSNEHAYWTAEMNFTYPDAIIQIPMPPILVVADVSGEVRLEQALGEEWVSVGIIPILVGDQDDSGENQVAEAA